jgi:predicted membrane chloride channel (bestrophin family)
MKIIDEQTVIVTFLAVLSTFLCDMLKFYADMPTGLIGIAIVFPIVFSINNAYKRREEALKYFASVKANLLAIFYGHRDWVKDNRDHTKRVRTLTERLLNDMKEYFHAEPEKEADKLEVVYYQFSQFSQSHELLRIAKVPAPEISSLNKSLQSLVTDFERMRNIFLYRTPIALRAYSQIFLNIFPIIFGPYFARLCDTSYPIIGYGVAILYSIVLVSLDNIQEDLENPFDEIGADDVKLDVADEYLKLIKAV